MKAEITFSQVWSNPSVRRFWFREQSENTLQELANLAEDWEDALERIEDYAERMVLNLDDIEEMFYEYQIEDLAKEFEIDLYYYCEDFPDPDYDLICESNRAETEYYNY